MDFSRLLQEALEERGNAVLLIACPAEAEQAVIRHSNNLFAGMVGQPARALVGRRIGLLQDVFADAKAWSSFIASLHSLVPMQMDLRLRSDGRDTWIGFGLTFKTDAQEGESFGVLIGRDITHARQKSARENESQRLLAAMFLRTSAALLVVKPDGCVLMANPAFQRLLGYTAEEVVTLNVRNLAAGRSSTVAQAAREQQLRDGRSYEIRIETIAKNGTALPVRLTSELVRDDVSGSLRVVTLLPDFMGPTPALAAAPVAAVSDRAQCNVGQLQAISLVALKTAFVEVWPRVALRAMLLAEQIIRRRLSASDVITRSNDDGFVIWFDENDEAVNTAALVRAAREIKLKFLSEFGEELAACVSAVVVGDVDAPPPPGVAPSEALLSRLQDKRQDAGGAAKRLAAQLRHRSSAVVQPITDREGRLKPFVLVDFSLELRRQAAAMMATMAGAEATESDLLRLGFAATELATRPGGVLTSVSWRTLADPASRRIFDKWAAHLGIESRANLQLAVFDVPPFPSAKRWSEIVGPLRRTFGEMGLQTALAEDETTADAEAAAAEWPVSFLVIDATAASSLGPEGYFGVIAAARGRNLAVLARVGTAANARDWREVGATMFASA